MSPLDETSTLNARVAVLEDWREEHRAWMAEIRTLVQTLSNNVMSLRLCASPNLCMSLSKEIEELAKENKNAMARIESLERWRTFISGVVATVAVLWLVFQVLIPWVMKLAGVELGG